MSIHALHGMITRSRELGMYNVAVVSRLLDTMVTPVLNYGCVLWGMYELRQLKRLHWSGPAAVEDLHKCCLRTVLQVPACTTTAPMMNELRRCPLAHAWIKQSVTWWNKVVARPDHDLVKIALGDSIGWAREGAGAIECWGAAWLHAIKSILPPLAHQVMNMQPVSVTEVCDGLHALWQAAAWGDHLHYADHGVQHRAWVCQRTGFKTATYRHWFCRGKPSDGEPSHCPVPRRLGFIYHVQRPNQVRALACFRLSAHELNIERLRHTNIDRSQRFCKCCTANVVEDEMHILECPAYHHIRQSFSDVLGDVPHPICDADMYNIMNPSEAGKWRRLATFLLKVMDERTRILSV